MSTTFDVYPISQKIPTFSAILERATPELHRFLGSVGVKARPPIHVRLQRKVDHAHLPFDLHGPACWDKDVYAWFTVGEIPGGTDVYYDDSTEDIRVSWEEELENPKYNHFEATIRQAMQVGHSWSFRRSAGQWATTNIAYGLIAASFADLTQGFIHSIDSAWDWDRLPAYPADFLKWYFRPEFALEEDFRAWSEGCIDSLPEELDG